MKLFRKKTKFWLIYLPVTFVFCFFSLELLTRLFHLAPPLPKQYSNNVPDPYIAYKPRPNSVNKGRSATGEFDYLYEINSLGFRDVEHTFSKPEGVYRILGIGDSFTYGGGAPFEDTYLYRLEELLNSRRESITKVEIIKTGIAGMFPQPERKLLDTLGRKFEPDLILIAFLPNDVIDTFKYNQGLVINVGSSGYLMTGAFVKISKRFEWLIVHSHLVRAVCDRFLFYLMEGFRNYIAWKEIYKPNGLHEDDWREVESEYLRMIEIANQIDSKIAFIHIPQKGPWDDSAFYPGERLSKFCEKNGVTFIDTLSALKEASKSKVLYWEKDGHCTIDGYKVIADTVYLKLIEGKLIF